MSILRKHVTKGLKANFTVVSNTAPADARLSVRAVGLHTIMLSKPEGWDFDTVRLSREHTEGRDAIRNAKQELEDLGYVDTRRLQNGDGTWYTVVDVYQEPLPMVAGEPAVDTDDGLSGVGLSGVGTPGVGGSGDKERTTSKDVKQRETTSPCVRAERGREQVQTRTEQKAKARAARDEARRKRSGTEDEVGAENDDGRRDPELPPVPVDPATPTALARYFKARALRLTKGTPQGTHIDLCNVSALAKNIKNWGAEPTAVRAAIDLFMDDPRRAGSLDRSDRMWVIFCNQAPDLFARVDAVDAPVDGEVRRTPPKRYALL